MFLEIKTECNFLLVKYNKLTMFVDRLESQMTILTSDAF